MSASTRCWGSLTTNSSLEEIIAKILSLIFNPDEPNFFLDWVVSKGGVTPGWPLSALTIFANRSSGVGAASFRGLSMMGYWLLPRALLRLHSDVDRGVKSLHSTTHSQDVLSQDLTPCLLRIPMRRSRPSAKAATLLRPPKPGQRALLA